MKSSPPHVLKRLAFLAILVGLLTPAPATAKPLAQQDLLKNLDKHKGKAHRMRQQFLGRIRALSERTARLTRRNPGDGAHEIGLLGKRWLRGPSLIRNLTRHRTQRPTHAKQRLHTQPRLESLRLVRDVLRMTRSRSTNAALGNTLLAMAMKRKLTEAQAPHKAFQRVNTALSGMVAEGSAATDAHAFDASFALLESMKQKASELKRAMSHAVQPATWMAKVARAKPAIERVVAAANPFVLALQPVPLLANTPSALSRGL